MKEEGQFALHYVCSRETVDLEMLKFVLKQKGVSANTQDNRGWTALHSCAFTNADAEAISLLLASGAETDAATVDGTRALDYFVRKEPKDIEKYEAALDSFFRSPHTINGQNLLSGETTLHSAIRSSTTNSKVIELLLAKGADPNLANQQNDNALHYAVISMRLDVVEMLLKYGADPRKTSAKGTPLEIAEQMPRSPDKDRIKTLLSTRLAELQSSRPGKSIQDILASKQQEMREVRKLMEQKHQDLEQEMSALQTQLQEVADTENRLQQELEKLQQEFQQLTSTSAV